MGDPGFARRLVGRLSLVVAVRLGGSLSLVALRLGS